MLKSFRATLFSLVHLLFVLIVLSSGILVLLGSFLMKAQVFGMHLLLEYPNLIRSIGIFLAASGGLMLYGFSLMYQGRYYKIEMGLSKVLIEESIVRSYIAEYWKELFPKEEICFDVVIHAKQRIEIVTRLPKSLEGGASLFAKLENDLGKLLFSRIGYTKKFTFTVLA